MPEFTLRNYLEIEATVGPEEDQEDDEEEFGKSVLIFGMPLGLIVYTVEDFFINENADADTTSEHGTSWRPSPIPTPTDFTQEAAEIRARFARRFTSPSVHRDNEILCYHLVPSVSDPSLWSVRVKVRVSASQHFTASRVLKPGYESEIVLQIAHRTIPVDPRPSTDITSVFAREGIQDMFRFLKGSVNAVNECVRVEGHQRLYRVSKTRQVCVELRQQRKERSRSSQIRHCRWCSFLYLR